MQTKDNRETVDIEKLNAAITKTVERINTLRLEINNIINDLEG